VTTPSDRRRYLTRPVRTPRNKPRESVSRTWAIWRALFTLILIRPRSNRLTWVQWKSQVQPSSPGRILRGAGQVHGTPRRL
jgi:hypothetical protein